MIAWRWSPYLVRNTPQLLRESRWRGACGRHPHQSARERRRAHPEGPLLASRGSELALHRLTARIAMPCHSLSHGRGAVGFCIMHGAHGVHHASVRAGRTHHHKPRPPCSIEAFYVTELRALGTWQVQIGKSSGLTGPMAFTLLHGHSCSKPPTTSPPHAGCPPMPPFSALS